MRRLFSCQNSTHGHRNRGSCLSLARAIFHPAAILADLKDFDRGQGFFTIVAGAAVLGSGQS